MTDSDNDSAFIKSIRGAKPITKTNKVVRPIPKMRTPLQKRVDLTKIELEKPIEKKTKSISKNEFKVEKSTLSRKLKKGKITADQKIDFHGCALEEARQLFIRTVNNCFINNKRCILFVTGKGMAKKQPEDISIKKLYYGKIRNSFLEWTKISEIVHKILHIQQANIENGGDGAFFVYLRKNKN